MENLKYLLKTILTAGRQRQSFISAAWISPFLRLLPRRCKRKGALWVVSLSPHYFYRRTDPHYKEMNQLKFLEAEFERNIESRRKICEQILFPYLKETDAVLDYGCGPGFLAKWVSKEVKQVFAVDTSIGVLECARILNAAPNIVYLTPKDMKRKIRENSMDLAYSFAVIQHVTDSAFEEILEGCQEKMKTNSTLLLHVILNGGSRSEAEWRKDRSLYGRVKWRYGLNCFSRTEQKATFLVEKHGFTVARVVNLKEVCPDNFDDVSRQHLIVARTGSGVSPKTRTSLINTP